MMGRLSCLGWKLRYRLARWRRAWAYARGRLGADDAQTLMVDCEHIAGWYALMTITSDDVLDFAVSRHGEAALLLKPYLPAACERTARKWEGGDDHYAALEIALDTATDWAAEHGIDVRPNEDNSDQQPQGEQPHA
jgi:hypothetical protein